MVSLSKTFSPIAIASTVVIASLAITLLPEDIEVETAPVTLPKVEAPEAPQEEKAPAREVIDWRFYA